MLFYSAPEDATRLAPTAGGSSASDGDPACCSCASAASGLSAAPAPATAWLRRNSASAASGDGARRPSMRSSEGTAICRRGGRSTAGKDAKIWRQAQQRLSLILANWRALALPNAGCPAGVCRGHLTRCLNGY